MTFHHKQNLLGHTPESLCVSLAEEGVDLSIDQARRITGHIISLGHQDLSLLKRPPKNNVIKHLEDRYEWNHLEVVERSKDDADAFVKYLFKHPDGSFTEAVRIPLEKKGRYTVCLSSQVGCAMRCTFCATGKLGLTRNLEVWEMMSAFMRVREDLKREFPDARLTGAVFMGQGEPFHNYDNVICTAKLLCHPCGGRITGENITISTVGLVPHIRRYAEENHPFRLIISLTSAVPEKRKSLLPVAGNFSMEEVVDAVLYLTEKTKKRATLAWVLMGGINHGMDEILGLETWFKDVPVRINLIDINDTDDTYVRATDEERQSFISELSARKIPFIRRYSGGKNKHAACGMLAKVYTEIANPDGMHTA